MYLIRWSHVFLIYIMIALAYASGHVTEGTFYYYFFKSLIGAVFAFLVVDLICGYFVKVLLADLENYDSLDERRKKTIQKIFFKKFIEDKESIQYLNTFEKQTIKKFFLDILKHDHKLDPYKKGEISDILKELDK